MELAHLRHGGVSRRVSAVARNLAHWATRAVSFERLRQAVPVATQRMKGGSGAGWAGGVGEGKAATRWTGAGDLSGVQ
eukprot:249121-Chlamydomonas_euryale.AAC.2